MSEQKTLFAPPPATGNLKPRQAIVYELLQQAGAGHEWAWAPDEIGALLCHRKGRHGPDERCDWDASNGNGVLKALRAKGLAKYRRGRGWIALQGQEPPTSSDGSYDPATAEIPF